MFKPSIRFRVGPWNVPVLVQELQPLDREGRPNEGLIDFDEPAIRLWSSLKGRRRVQLLWHELWHLKRYHLGVPEGMEVDCKVSSAFIEDLQNQLDAQGGRAALDALPVIGADGQVRDPQSPVPNDSTTLRVQRESTTGGWRVQELKLVDVGQEFPEPSTQPQADPWTDDVDRSRLELRLGGAASADCATPACGRVFAASDVWTGPVWFCSSVSGRVVGGQVVNRELLCPACGIWQLWLEGFDPVRNAPNGTVVALLERSDDARKIEAFHKKLTDQRRASVTFG